MCSIFNFIKCNQIFSLFLYFLTETISSYELKTSDLVSDNYILLRDCSKVTIYKSIKKNYMNMV